MSRLVGAAVALMLLLPAAAAARPRSMASSPLLWATVNVCNTPGHPGMVGIRASMPGTGARADRMYMRFRVQYFSSAQGMWHNLLSGGDSGWIPVGSALWRSRQAGRTFRFDTPPPGTQEVLRGAVTFEWRRGTRVVHHAARRTTEGHASTAGADPKGYSAAVCDLGSS